MKNTQYINLFLTVLTALILNTACTEKIDLKLQDSTPQLVIEGNISDKPGPYYVILSKSRLYYEDNSFTGMPGAVIVLSDDAGNADTLTEAAPGLYLSNTIQGTIGRTYHLEVNSEGVQYNSYCYMPAAVNIDSVSVQLDQQFNGEERKEGRVYFTDPAGIENYYRVVSTKNGELSNGFNIHRDRLWDGKARNYGTGNGELTAGDTLTVDLWSIDAHVYDYFNEFNQNDGFAQPAAPANPTSVFTPKALGYFSAHSVKSQTIYVP